MMSRIGQVGNVNTPSTPKNSFRASERCKSGQLARMTSANISAPTPRKSASTIAPAAFERRVRISSSTSPLVMRPVCTVAPICRNTMPMIENAAISVTPSIG